MRKVTSDARKKKSGQAATEPPHWRFFNAMKFVNLAESENNTVSESNLVRIPPISI